VTQPGRAALLLVIAWLLAAVALLAAQGMLVTYAGAVGASRWSGSGSERWSASSAPHPCSTARHCPNATEWLTTCAALWMTWWP
jgi:hypothetical protein